MEYHILRSMVNAPRDGTSFIAMHENICLQDVVYCGEHNGEQWWFDATSLRPLVRCCENFFVEWSPLGEGMTPPFRAAVRAEPDQYLSQVRDEWSEARLSEFERCVFELLSHAPAPAIEA